MKADADAVNRNRNENENETGALLSVCSDAGSGRAFKSYNGTMYLCRLYAMVSAEVRTKGT